MSGRKKFKAHKCTLPFPAHGERRLFQTIPFFPHKTFFLLDHALPPEGPCVVQKRGDTQELLDGLHRGCWVDTKFLPIHNQQLKGQGCGSLQIPKTGLKGGILMKALGEQYLSRGIVSQPALQVGRIVARDKTTALQGAKYQRGLRRG